MRAKRNPASRNSGEVPRFQRIPHDTGAVERRADKLALGGTHEASIGLPIFRCPPMKSLALNHENVKSPSHTNEPAFRITPTGRIRLIEPANRHDMWGPPPLHPGLSWDVARRVQRAWYRRQARAERRGERNPYATHVAPPKKPAWAKTFPHLWDDMQCGRSLQVLVANGFGPGIFSDEERAKTREHLSLFLESLAAEE